MFVISLDDVYTNRFKNGWFTLLKFTDHVKEKPHLIDEMRAFGQTKLVKPEVTVFRVIKAPVLAKGKSVTLAKLNLKIGLGDDDKDDKDDTPLPNMQQPIKIMKAVLEPVVPLL
jgi:hypothetical protein